MNNLERRLDRLEAQSVEDPRKRACLRLRVLSSDEEIDVWKAREAAGIDDGFRGLVIVCPEPEEL